MDPAERQQLQTVIQSQGAMLGHLQNQTDANVSALASVSAVADQALLLASSPSAECKLAPPERFFGDATKCSAFLASLRLLFELQPNSFSTERRKVAYTLSLLGGRAHEWGMAEWEKQDECCSSFNKFAEELSSIFNPCAHRRVMAARLFRLSQGSQSIVDYTIEFRTLAASTNWREETLCDKYYEGLADSVKDELAGHALPTRLKELISLAVATGQRFTERQTERHLDRRSRGRAAPVLSPVVSGGSSSAMLPRQGDRHQATPPSPPPVDPGDPMQLDRTRLPAAERQRRLVGALCLYCGEPGHRVRQCPLNGSTRQSAGRR
uniref:CCHC-type domain-containing protein n=1 Tax=Anabas testudineus TaxID=64144 RepID=A0A3Q1JES3_ANATE